MTYEARRQDEHKKHFSDKVVWGEAFLCVLYNNGTDKEVVSMMKTGVAVSGAQTTI